MVKSKKNKKSATETTVNYEYDDLYRLKKKDFPTGTDAEFEYDAASRLTKMKDASGEKRFSYDNANRLTKVLQGPVGFVENTNHNTKVEHTWNDANQRTTLTMTIRTLSAKTWTYNFGKPGFLDSIDDPDESNPFGLEYLIDGRLKKITLPNDATREVFYQDTDDNHDFVTGKRKFLRKTLDKTTTPTTICSFTYELDAAGRRKSMTDKDGKYFPYALDPNSQLAAETKWSAKTPGTRNYQYAYAYDANGNRIEEFADGVRTQYTVGDANQLISAGTVEFTYDQFLNTATMQDTASIDPETVFSWDFESNMVGVQYATGDPHADTHEYDATGRRMRSKFDDATDWTNFVYDEVTGNLIAEYTLISGTYTLSATYTWGAGLLKQQRGGTKRFYHFDGSGNTAALSDGSQSITDTYSYNAFGVAISSSGSSVNPYRWGGASGIYDDSSRGSVFAVLFLGNNSYLPTLADILGGKPKPAPQPKPGPGSIQEGFYDAIGVAPPKPRPTGGYELWKLCMSEAIKKHCGGAKVDSKTLYAYVWCIIDGESSWDPNKVTYIGPGNDPAQVGDSAIGLMQITPINQDACSKAGYGDYKTNPCSNIACGVMLLCKALKRSGGDVFSVTWLFYAINQPPGRFKKCLADKFGIR